MAEKNNENLFDPETEEILRKAFDEDAKRAVILNPKVMAKAGEIVSIINKYVYNGKTEFELLDGAKTIGCVKFEGEGIMFNRPSDLNRIMELSDAIDIYPLTKKGQMRVEITLYDAAYYI